MTQHAPSWQASAAQDAQAQGIEAQIWLVLQEACRDRAHAWRTPVLASTGLDGAPQARTVVLRDVDANARELLVFTDQRSPKVQELRQAPRATLVFWSPALNWQLRVAVQVHIETAGPAVDRAWARISQSAAAQDYLAAAAPGAALAPGLPPVQQHQLAILRAQVLAIDWLELAPSGHRRARFDGNGVTFLVP
jgi:pyridoxamine 5'-phosphate oxidase